MKSPLSAAISARRKPEMPVEAKSQLAPQEGQSPEESKVQSMLASLGEDEKLELFEALKSELQSEDGELAEGEDDSAPDAMTDQSGQLKSTPGEKAALGAEGLAPGVAESMGAQGFSGDEEGTDLLSRARINIAKLIKTKGK